MGLSISTPPLTELTEAHLEIVDNRPTIHNASIDSDIAAFAAMVFPLTRCRASLRYGTCTRPLSLLRTRQCLPRSFTQSSIVAARSDILSAWDKCTFFFCLC